MFRSFRVASGSALAFALLLGLATQWPKPGTAAAAEAERQVQVPYANRNDAVVVTKITLGDTEVQAGRFIKPGFPDLITPFQAGDDWIQNLTIYLLNRTNRTIVCIHISLGFPDTGDGFTRRQFTYGLNFGRIPPPAALDQSGKPLAQPPDWQPISFRAGETMVIRLSDHIDQIRANAEPHIPLATATKLAIRLSSSYFPDGMKWAAGGYTVPDPQAPGNWRSMGRGHFPGDMDWNWPGRPGWTGHK